MRLVHALLLPFLSLAALAAENPTEEGGSNSFNESIGRQATLEFSYEPETDLAAGGGYSYRDMRLSTPLFGKRLGEKWIIGARLRYRLSEFDWTGQDLYDNGDLHRLELSLTLVYKPEASPWLAFLSAGPALASDCSAFDGDDLMFVAITGVGYRFSESFTLLGGAYFSQDFGEPRLIPAPGFIWTPSEHWTLSLIPPRLRIAWKPSTDWRLGVEAFPNGGRWSVTTMDGQDAFLDRSGARAGLRLERRCFGKGWLHVAAGCVFSRDLVLETTGGRKLFESDADTGPYVNAGFIWSF